MGEHWHAALTIRVCGQELVEPQFPGEIHTHGDGLIHIHPGSDASAGKNATLRTYFEGSQIGLTATSIRLPGRPEFTGSSECPNGRPGQLSVRINDGERAGFLDYPLQDGDRIDIVFKRPRIDPSRGFLTIQNHTFYILRINGVTANGLGGLGTPI